MPDKVKVLYDALSGQYDLGSFQDFKTKMSDQGKRKALYDAVGEEYDLGTFDDFNRKLMPSGPITPSKTQPTGLPTFEEQQATLQQVQSKYDKAVQDDRSKAGKLAATVYNGLVGSLESIAGGAAETFYELGKRIPTPQYDIGGNKLVGGGIYELTPEQQKQARVELKKSIKAGGDVIRSKYVTREEEQQLQGKFDLSNGLGLDDFAGLTAMSGRIVGDLGLGALTGGASFVMQGYSDAVDDYDEAAKSMGLPENANARALYGIAGGTINGLLEKFAIDKLVGDGPVFKAIQKKAIANVLKNTSTMTGKAAIDGIEKFAKEEIKELTSNIKSKGLRAGYRALVEGGTEGLQAALEDGAKFASNWAQGQQVFNQEEIKNNFAKNILNSAAAGAVFGPVIGFGVDKTFGRNINTEILNDIANAKTQEDIDKLNQDLEDTFNKNNFSEEERKIILDNARRYAEVKQTLPSDTPAEVQKIAIPKIEDRLKLDNEIQAKKNELENIDESVKPSYQEEISLLQDKRASINDEIAESVSGVKYNYIEDNGKFFKETGDGKREEISKNRYDLEQIKQEDYATTEGQRPVQEGGTEGGIGQRPGTQEGGTQGAPTKADSRYRNISSEKTVGIPTLLGAKVTYKLPNRKITGTLIQEGQTLSVEDENGDVVAELGNIDELSNMSPEEMNLTVIESKVEPTEKGFAVDGKELFNENENPFDAVSVDPNGNVMNVVLTTAGGKRRKFRGRVAQDLATQISAKEDTKVRQADERLQQEMALPTPQAPIVITTQPAIAKVTEDNLDTIDKVEGTPIQKKVLGDLKPVVKAIAAAVRSITGAPVSVNVHNQESFNKAVEEAGGTSEEYTARGFYMASDGSIHLNMDNIDSDTMLHEGFHPILDALEKFNPQVINELFTQLESIPEAADIISNARENYDEDITQKKEAITDFVAGVADGRIVLNPSNFQKIKAFIINMLNRIGLGGVNPEFMKVDNEQDLVKLATFITERFKTGETITLENLDSLLVGTNQYNSSDGIDIDVSVPNKGNGENPQFSKNTLQAARDNVKSIKDFIGTQISRVVFYDITRVGKLTIKNIKTGYTPDVDGKGGPMYSYMDNSLKNKAVLAFVSINQAIQSLQRQQLYPEGVHAIASQNPLTAHLGNKSTLQALFGEGVGIFQNAAKTKAQEKEIVQVLVSELERISNMPETAEASKSVNAILQTVKLSDIKTIADFRDKIMLGDGDSFGKRGSILTELLQNKQSKVTAATRESHKILHYKYGIPTIADIAIGNNQEEFSNVEMGDVMKFVKPSTEPVIYTTDKAAFDRYSKNPTPEMKKAGIRIELLPESDTHESYPFILAGENVGLLDEYIGAQQLFERFKGIKKSQTFFKIGRMKKYAEAGMVSPEVVGEKKGPAFQKVPKSEQQKRINTASERLKEIFNRENIPLSISEAKDIVNEVIEWASWYDGISEYAGNVFGEYAEDFLSLLPLSSQANASEQTVSLAINNIERIYKGEKPKGIAEYYGYVTDFLAGKGIQSDKMYNFFKALNGDKNAIAVDMHVWSIIMGKDPNKEQVNPKNKKEFDRAKEFVNTLANELGMAPREIQASLWAANILRTGGKPDSYEEYITKQLEKGLSERIEGWRQEGYKPFSEVRKAREAVREKGGTPQFQKVGKINWEKSKEGKGDPSISSRNPIVVEAAKKLKEGKITNEEYRATISQNSPISPITRFFEPATEEQINNALSKDKIEKINAPISDGTTVGLRLDIPAYSNNNTWVVSVHEGDTNAGKAMSYRNVARITDVRFGVEPKAALSIAAGVPKTTIGRMFGKWSNIEGNTMEEQGENAKDLVQSIVDDPNYVQVGMNPFRHSYFYDRNRDLGRPIVSADEVIQIGGLVYAKNPVYGNWTDESYKVKGLLDAAGQPVQFQKSPTKTVKQPVKRFLKDQFIVGGILGKDIMGMKEEMAGELSDEMTKAEDISKKATNLIKKYSSVVTSTDIEDFLTSKPNANRQIPMDLAATLAEMRAHVDNLTERLINLGVIDDPEEVAKYRENKGKYLLRSYEIFNSQPTAMEKLLLGKSKTRIDIDNVKKKLKNVDQAKVDNALRFLEKQISKGDPTLTPEQVKEQAIIEANKILADTESKYAPKKYIGSTNVKSLEARLDIAPEIRALMGEYTDPIYNYYASIFKIAALTSNRKFLNDMKEQGMGKYLFKEATRDASVQIASEGSDALKPLAGLYTFPEIKEALEKQEKLQASIVSKMLGRFRMLKTVYNPGTHVKNIIGNAGFFISNGHWTYMDKVWDVMKSNPKEREELMSILRKQGVLNSSVGIGELNSYFDRYDNVEDFLSSIQQKANDKSIKGKTKQQIDAIKRTAKDVNTAIKKAYQLEDDVFKIMAFVNESNRYANALFNKDYSKLDNTEKAEINKIASNNVKNTYPTFSRAPKFVKNLSKVLLLGNFLTFPVESVRISYNTLKLAKDEVDSGNPKLRAIGMSRIIGTLAYNSIFSTLMYYMSMAGVGLGGMLGSLFDDEEEKDTRDAINLLREPFTNNSDIIPTKFSDGKLVYTDIGSLDSYSYQKKVWNAFWDNIDDEEGFKKAIFASTKQLVDPYMTFDFTFQAFKDLYDNNEEATGRQVYNPEAKYDDKVVDVGKFLIRKFGPGIVNSMIKSYAFYQEGDTEKLKNEIISQGVRTYTVDTEKRFARNIYAERSEGNKMTDVGFKERLDDAEKIYTDIKNNKSSSQQEKDAAYTQAISAYKNILNDVSKYYQATLRSGVSNEKLITILLRARLGDQRGKPEIYSIMKGVADLPDETYIRK